MLIVHHKEWQLYFTLWIVFEWYRRPLFIRTVHVHNCTVYFPCMIFGKRNLCTECTGGGTFSALKNQMGLLLSSWASTSPEPFICRMCLPNSACLPFVPFSAHVWCQVIPRLSALCHHDSSLGSLVVQKVAETSEPRGAPPIWISQGLTLWHDAVLWKSARGLSFTWVFQLKGISIIFTFSWQSQWPLRAVACLALSVGAMYNVTATHHPGVCVHAVDHEGGAFTLQNQKSLSVPAFSVLGHLKFNVPKISSKRKLTVRTSIRWSFQSWEFGSHLGRIVLSLGFSIRIFLYMEQGFFMATKWGRDERWLVYFWRESLPLAWKGAVLPEKRTLMWYGVDFLSLKLVLLALNVTVKTMQ